MMLKYLNKTNFIVQMLHPQVDSKSLLNIDALLFWAGY